MEATRQQMKMQPRPADLAATEHQELDALFVLTADKGQQSPSCSLAKRSQYSESAVSLDGRFDLAGPVVVFPFRPCCSARASASTAELVKTLSTAPENAASPLRIIKT
jgi:hypothetical protein